MERTALSPSDSLYTFITSSRGHELTAMIITVPVIIEWDFVMPLAYNT